MIVLLLFSQVVFTPEFITNHNYWYDLTVHPPYVYGATNGGVVRRNLNTGAEQCLTCTAGLGLNRQTCVACDSSGYLWVGNETGLYLVDTSFSTVLQYPGDYLPSSRVSQLWCLRDTVMVGTTYGFLLINTRGTTVDFGDDERVRIFFEDGLPSNVITAVAADSLYWIGTDAGIAAYSKQLEHRANYSTAHGLLANMIMTIRPSDTALYVGTPAGLNRFATGSFDTVIAGYQIRDIAVSGDTLLLALDSTRQFGIYAQGAFSVIRTGLPWLARVGGVEVYLGNWLCGLGNRYMADHYGEGLARYDPDTSRWVLEPSPGLPSNHVAEVVANEHGIFTAHGNRSYTSRGIGWLDTTGTWHNYLAADVLPSDHVHRCANDAQGRVWFALNAISNNGKDTVMAFRLDPVDTTWQFLPVGFNGMETTDAVWDIELDGRGNVYLLLGRTSNRLWVIDSGLTTPYWLDPAEGFFVEIAVDSLGRIWRTIVDNGVRFTDPRGTLFERSDDITQALTTSNGLASNTVRGCAADCDRTCYVATRDALCSSSDGQAFLPVADVSEQDLIDVELDNQGRVWILARDGISFYDPTNEVAYSWRFADHNVALSFIPEGTEMIQVQALFFDAARSAMYIGGETGLLVLHIDSQPAADPDCVLLYPNPIAPGRTLRVRNLPADARISVYSVAGRCLASDIVPEVFGEVVWRIPEDLGSGVYYLLVRSRTGNRTVPFAVVR